MKVTARNDDPTRTELLALLQDAAVMRLAACAFTYPDTERRETIASGFAEIAKAQEGRLATEEWAPQFLRAHAKWKLTDGAIESDYIRLFLGSAPCPLHESAYGDGRRMGGRVVELADVAGFYRAFGFALSPLNRDLPDHIAAELEFAAALLLKEGYALAEGMPEERDITRQAAADFFLVHLGRWPGALCDALVESGAPDTYLTLVDLVVALVAAQCRRHGVVPVLSQGRFEVDAAEEDCVSCPMAATQPVH